MILMFKYQRKTIYMFYKFKKNMLLNGSFIILDLKIIKDYRLMK